MIYDADRMGVVACDCGRPSTKIHCPYCGSFDTRARAQLTVSRLDPGTEKTKEYQVHRCRKCGKLFDEYQVKFECKAPVPVIKGLEIKGLSKKGLGAAMSTGLVNAGKPLDENQLNELTERAKRQAATKVARVWTQEELDEAARKSLEEDALNS